MAIGATPAQGFSPDEQEPEGFYEVINGQIVEKPPMSALEFWIAARLIRAMNRLGAIDQIGQVVHEMLFLIDPEKDLKRRPDVAFVSCERWPLDRQTPSSNAWEVVPDLAVEVISPTNKAVEVVERLEEYFNAGARLVWVIFPNVKTVYVYESPKKLRILQDGDELDGGSVLPGFRLPIGHLFGTD